MDVDRTPQLGQIVVVAVHGELHLKQVLQRTETGLYLTSARGDLVVPDDGVEYLGVIVRITHDKPSRSMTMGVLAPAPTRLTPGPSRAKAVGNDDD